MSRNLVARTQCPACQSPVADGRRLFELPFMGSSCAIVRCDCGLVYKDRAPDAEALRSLYPEGYVHFQDQSADVGMAEVNSARQKLARCGRLLRGPVPSGGWRLLDVGCGAGYFVGIARELGYAAEGLDAYLPKGLENDHLHRGLLKDMPAASFDVVTLLNVAEHLVDPGPLFADIRRVLKPGGVLLLSCPYGASLACRFHRDRWVHMGLDEHLLFWTPTALSAFLRRQGFIGSSSCRIAGSPFPYGRTAPVSPTAGDQTPVRAEAGPSWQARIWTWARWIQRQERTTNVLRRLIHWSRTGDYLEYAVRVSR